MTSANVATTNRWDTRTLVTMALLAAIGAALSFIEFPFGVQFLKYDASNIPALVGGFVFGAGPGVIIGVITCLIHAIFTGDWLGCLMNIMAMIAVVLPSAILYKHRRRLSSGIIGLIIGIVLSTAVMVGLNLLLDPPLYGMPYESVVALVVPVLIPFNLLKGGINAVVTILVYKPISNLVKPKKTGAAVAEPDDTASDDTASDDAELEDVESDGAERRA